jgi:hypothetical protein
MEELEQDVERVAELSGDMPPGWAHFVANADADSLLIFGA